MTKGNLNNLDKSFVQNLSNNWALVTSGASDNYNMMTVNWGGIGFLWNKPVLFIFIRPERYTFEFIEKYDYFSLSFLNVFKLPFFYSFPCVMSFHSYLWTLITENYIKQYNTK
jgi:hypothetical protein